jgi:anti-anti-sigma factor
MAQPSEDSPPLPETTIFDWRSAARKGTLHLPLISDDGEVARLACDERLQDVDVGAAVDLFIDRLGATAFSRRVLLSMEGVKFIDSSAVAWLLRAHRHFATEHGQLVLHSLPDCVRGAIRTLRVQQLLNIATDEAEALRRVGAG